MATEEIATHDGAPTTERKPPKRRASEAEVDLPESADVDTAVEQLKNDMERLAKQNHEEVITLTKQNNDKIMSNARRHFVYDETRKQRVTRECRSKDRKLHERT